MRKPFHSVAVTTGLLALAICGCSSLMDKRTEAQARREKVRQRLEAENRPMILSQIASPRQLGFAAIMNIALITHLADTGGIVSPSQQREKLLDAMRRNEIPDPNKLLDSKQTAMVTAKSFIPPAARAGERHNVNVQLSKHSQATDLCQGWLRETPLMEIGLFEGEGRLRTSFDYAKAEGSLVTNAQFSGSTDPQAKLEAVVVGGARLVKSRDIGLGVSADYADAITMASIVPVINSRFTYFDGTGQKGVAIPMTDEYIELNIPARYQHDPYHFVNVVLRIGFNEPAEQRDQRIKRLATEVANPLTVREAVWQLEALGTSSVEILASQLGNANPEVQFYCAHALAYLGDQRAIEPLKELAQTQSAFRAMSLTALGSMENYQAEDAIRLLLNCPEAEARYGAVTTLRKRNAKDPLVSAQLVPKVGGLLEIPSSGPELVAVSMHETAEVVFFGQVPQLNLPPFHNVNPNILLQMTGPREVTITRFAPDQDDITVTCRPDLRSVLLAIGQIGGGYGDWVSFVRECQSLGFMATPVAMNPVPVTGRTFDRESGSEETESPETKQETVGNQDDSTAKVSSAWYKPWTWRK